MNFKQFDLILELQKTGIKHSPDKIIRITKTTDNRIIFLEEGNPDSGLQHIIENHGIRFVNQGISLEEIPDVIMIAITTGEIVGMQGKKHLTPRIIYRYNFNNMIKYIAIQIGSNGYIVSANPRSSN